MSTPNLCKDSFIGDYPIVNCQYYGAFEMFDDLKLGEGLSLEIEDKSIVKVKKDGIPIGELQLSDTDKNKLLPYLNQGLDDIYTCKLSQNCKDAKIIATEYKIISLFNAFKIIIFKRTNRF